MSGYHAVVGEIEYRAKAFYIILKNQQAQRSQILEYVYTIDEIEARAPLPDFSQELNDTEEDAL